MEFLAAVIIFTSLVEILGGPFIIGKRIEYTPMKYVASLLLHVAVLIFTISHLVNP